MIRKELFLIAGLLVNFKNMTMNPEVLQKIGKQIWHNEAGGSQEHLVFWNEKESFPSLGIGHNIWCPEGHEIAYTQGFPLLCDYLKQHNIALPAWLEEALKKGAPWNNRQAFYSDQARTQELRQLLVDTVPLQTQFMVDRLTHKLAEIIQAAPVEQRNKIEQRINLMRTSPLGIYILVDYLNFKGDGLNPKEESNGLRWGMLSVLLDMPDNLTSENVTKAFTVAAAKRLLLLIEHSAPEYQRLNFLGGWMKRLSTYTKQDILD